MLLCLTGQVLYGPHPAHLHEGVKVTIHDPKPYIRTCMKESRSPSMILKPEFAPA